MLEKSPQNLDAFDETARDLYRDHNSAVHTRDYNNMDAKKNRKLANTLGLSGNQYDAAGLDEDQKSKMWEAESRMRTSLHQEADQQEDKALRADTDRKALLWDAHEHLGANREIYENAALEDATAAGHDVNFGGEHYPAQQPEEPKELQHQ